MDGQRVGKDSLGGANNRSGEKVSEDCRHLGVGREGKANCKLLSSLVCGSLILLCLDNPF